MAEILDGAQLIAELESLQALADSGEPLDPMMLAGVLDFVRAEFGDDMGVGDIEGVEEVADDGVIADLGLGAEPAPGGGEDVAAAYTSMLPMYKGGKR